MRLTDLLALSHVPRWGIVPHLIPQTVGDHTFRVLVIAMEIAERLGEKLSMDEIRYCLYHDVVESRTGDIPTPAKTHLSTDWTDFCPWLPPAPDDSIRAIVDLADLVEAYTFISRYGIGEHARRARIGMQARIAERMENPQLKRTVDSVIDDILIDAGR